MAGQSLNGKNILQISNLTKIYRKSHFGKTQETIGVKNLDLEIPQGEIFGLLGLNGAGKTTTLKLILSLLFPDSGHITVLGKALPDKDAAQKIGFLPEVPYFPDSFSVEEILTFYGRLSGIAQNHIKNRTEEVLRLTKMLDRKNKRIGECSKGMLQRLSLAQSLIHDPSLLVLDEPVTGLDPLGLNEMRDTILKLNQEGKTILFSSHIISEVEKIAHRVGILIHGRLMKIVPSKEWSGQSGTLEKMFVETLRENGALDLV